MIEVKVLLPDEIFTTLNRSPHEMEGDLRLAGAIDWYRLGLVSQGRAAEISGLSRVAFIEALAARGVEPVQVDMESLEDEIRRV